MRTQHRAVTDVRRLASAVGGGGHARSDVLVVVLGPFRRAKGAVAVRELREVIVLARPGVRALVLRLRLLLPLLRPSLRE